MGMHELLLRRRFGESDVREGASAGLSTSRAYMSGFTPSTGDSLLRARRCQGFAITVKEERISSRSLGARKFGIPAPSLSCQKRLTHLVAPALAKSSRLQLQSHLHLLKYVHRRHTSVIAIPNRFFRHLSAG